MTNDKSFADEVRDFQVDTHEICVRGGCIQRASAARSKGSAISASLRRQGDDFVLQRFSTKNGRDEVQYVNRDCSFMDASHSVPIAGTKAPNILSSPDPTKRPNLHNNGGNK